MKKTIKLKQAWTDTESGAEFVKGQILEVDADTAKSLVDTGVAEDHSETKAAEDLQKQINEGIASGLKKALEDDDGQKAIKTALSSITVGDEALDPSWGYGAPVAAGKSRSKGARLHNAAQYLRDVKEASGGQAPERLTKAMDVVEQMAKAAGTPGQIIAIDEDGGFAVPTETRMELSGATLDASPVRQAATIVPMSTKVLDITRVQDYDHSAGYVSGGAVAYWGTENGTLTASKIKTEKVKLDLEPLTALGFMSHQALKFSAISGGLLMQELGQAMAFAEEGAFLTDGTGAGMPQAIMKAEARIALTRGVALSVVHDDIVNMLARLRIKSDGAVKWIANKTLLPSFTKLNVAVGTGGAPVWIPSNDASKGIPGTLYGYPVQWSEYPAAKGSAGDLILGDFSQYDIGDFVEGPEAAESMHIKFLEAQTAFRIIKYVDGQVSPKKVFSPKNGDDLAPFVHLSTKLS